VIGLLAAGVAFGTDAATAEGLSIDRLGGAGGLAVRAATVAGVDGGTTAVTATARGVGGPLTWSVSLPFATFRTPDDRAAGLGNLGLAVFVPDDLDDPRWAWGVAVQIPLGHAWTWVSDGTGLWPQAGADLVVRSVHPGPWTTLWQLSLGAHVSSGYDPFPVWFPLVSATGAFDRSFGARAGLQGELALSWWDPSPADLGLLLRAEPFDGLHVRGGLVAPIAAWAGLVPYESTAHVKEIVLRYEVETRW
jgi:hypothetical protein